MRVPGAILRGSFESSHDRDNTLVRSALSGGETGLPFPLLPKMESVKGLQNAWPCPYTIAR